MHASASIENLSIDKKAATHAASATVEALLSAKEEYAKNKSHYLAQQTALFFATHVAGEVDASGLRKPLAILGDATRLANDAAESKAALEDGAKLKAEAATLRSRISEATLRLERDRHEARALRAELAAAMAELQAEQVAAAGAPPAVLTGPVGRSVAAAAAERDAASSALSATEQEHARVRRAGAMLDEQSSAEAARLTALRSAAEERKRDSVSGAQQLARMSAFYDGALTLAQSATGVRVLEASASAVRYQISIPARRSAAPSAELAAAAPPASAPETFTLSVVLAPVTGGDSAAAGAVSASTEEEDAELRLPRRHLAVAQWARSTPIAADLTPATVAIAPIVDAVLARHSGPAAVSALVHAVVARLLSA